MREDDDELPDAPKAAPVFAVPSLEGARIALRKRLNQANLKVTATPHCAVAIDVFTRDEVLIQRALAHAEVSPRVRDAFRELTDRTISRFADAQRIDAGANASYVHPSARRDGGGGAGGDPYRGGFVPSNDFAGFACGYALGIAQNRTAKLRDGLKGAGDLEIRLYAVPFLVATIVREGWLGVDDYAEEVVVLRRADGAYDYLPCDKEKWS
jgi:hypothetical protein